MIQSRDRSILALIARGFYISLPVLIIALVIQTPDWRARVTDGRLLNSGHASGGGVDGAAVFETTVVFELSEPEVARLEVFEEDMSDGEGFPPSRTVLPVVLAPGASSGVSQARGPTESG